MACLEDFVPPTFFFFFKVLKDEMGCKVPLFTFVPTHLLIGERLTHPLQRQAFPLEMFCKTKDLFPLCHCLSLSILPFDFSSSLLLSLWSIKEPGIQTPIRRLFRGLPSSQSASSTIKVRRLPQQSLWFIGLLCGKQSKLGLGYNDTSEQS